MSKERPSKEKIDDILKKRVAPLMALDNGDVEAVRYVRKGGKVEVRFNGNYEGAPCRQTLTDFVVKPVLLEMFSGIHSVEYVD